VVTVNVLPLSNAQFTETVIGATGVFTNQSTNAVTYSWNFGDASPANNTANPSHVYSINGTYTVTLTVTGPCGSDTYTMVITISQVGLQDNDLSSTLSLFPNPNDGNFTLSFDFTKTKDVTIQVLDVSGRIVFSDQENNVMNYNKQIGLDNAESGMYFVRIMTTEGVVIQKVMIQR
jgi:PKD repeat protein